MRLDLSVATARLVAQIAHGGAAPYAVNRIVIEGDSITSGMPSTPNGFYSYQYDDSRPDKFVEVRAQGSRVVGYPPNFALNDDQNSLISNVAEDMAYTPDLLTMMIGMNDLSGARTPAQYRGDLIAYYNAVKAARPSCRVAWSPPQPRNDDFATYGDNRAAIVADCRDPAVWGQWCDYFLPMGLHPDFLDLAVRPTLFNSGDNVHPNAAGHARFYASFKPAIDSIIDQARATSTVPYGSVWPASETNLAVGTEITRRLIVSGIHHAGLALGVSVSGGGAQVRLNYSAWGSAVGTGSGNGHRIYNGDVIDVKLTTSASNATGVSIDLTIGSETRTLTYTTVAAANPVDYFHGGTLTQVATSASHDFNGLAFAAGKPVVVLTSYSSAGGTVDSGPTSVVLTPSGGGSAILLTRRLEAMRGAAASRVAELWSAGVDVPAGNYDLDIARAAAASHSAFASGTLRNADAAPVGTAANSPAEPSQSNHATPAMTIPASGMALAFYLIEDDATPDPVAVTAPSIELAEVVAIGTAGVGICLAGRITSGPVEFVHRPGTAARGIVVFKAAGT